jgi:HD-GYP domain-containing protein (c-di-GMP phosphodiesterase class II)
VAKHVLPGEVSPLSSDQLLGIVSNLIDAKDPCTGGHSRRVAVLAVVVAKQLGLDDHMKSTLWAGGYLHDLGKLAVPLRVLTKKGKLTEEEFAYIRAHPTDGAEILENIPTLRHLTTGARYHHERWDGSGYPEGLSGGRIPMVGQIMAVCDSYDAMTSKCAYRDARAHPAAMAEVARCSGVHFSPEVSEAFLSMPEEAFEAAQAVKPERSERYSRNEPFFQKPSHPGSGRLSRSG